MNPRLSCRDDRRHTDVRRHRKAGHPDLNGIDSLEVSEGDPRRLVVYFLDKAPERIGPTNVRVDGGRRVRDLRIVEARVHRGGPDEEDFLTVRVNCPGDSSTYTLRLVKDEHGRPGDEPLAGFDPRYARIDFTFPTGGGADLDCAAQSPCPPSVPDEPEISYLAKDYASFRQVILDRLAVIMPGWTERHAPDLGIALVEVLAYVGDYLSYQQDAVATEAYLATARRRISVRRHARLVDYRMHEGCNARAWVHVRVLTDLTLDPDVSFITDPGVSVGPHDTLDQIRGSFEVFRPISTEPIALFEAHNEIRIYTWGDFDCCLPRGATSATLLDWWIGPGGAPRPPQQQEQKDPAPQAPPEPQRALRLKPGDVLVLEEVIGPRTGVEADADKTHRHVVRLTRVTPLVDKLYDQEGAPEGVRGTPLVEVEWPAEDALPFPLCLSTIGMAPECAELRGVSVARGNMILVDHGRPAHSVDWEVPAEDGQATGCRGVDDPLDPVEVLGEFSPTLPLAPLTQRTPFPVPAEVARGQAGRLGGLIERVLSGVRAAWRRAGGGTPLPVEDLRMIRTFFGAVALRRTGLIDPEIGEYVSGAAEQAGAIGRLLAAAEHLLARKARRVETLAARARAGEPLTEDDVQDLIAMFEGDAPPEVLLRFDGPFASDLRPSNAALAGPARGATRQDSREALPQVVLDEREQPGGAVVARWWPRFELLASDEEDRHFVAEVDDDGFAHLRFGDGTLGRAPTPGTYLEAIYRVGNGTAGNVGAETITVVVFGASSTEGIEAVRNPLPAVGGVDPEPVAEVKLLAPTAFRDELCRAIAADDYARLAEAHPGVQRAAAMLRWTGSGYLARVAIDPVGSEAPDPGLLQAIEEELERARRINHDVEVVPAHYVPLELVLTVRVAPHYLRGHVKAAVLDRLSNRVLPDGRRGFFHPDNLTFGQGIEASALVAMVMGVEGVENVRIDRLVRTDRRRGSGLVGGELHIGPLEIAQLDNDPNFPERGTLRVNPRGGR